MLTIITKAVYAQVVNYPFITLDDYDYIVNNPHITGGLTGQNISWAFISVDYTNYPSATLLSHMAGQFAIPPLHAESVAWEAEQKDAPSVLFCFSLADRVVLLNRSRLRRSKYFWDGFPSAQTLK